MLTYENQNGKKINGNRVWGIDVRLDGKIIGGIGASGGSSKQDAQVSQAGADALTK